MAMEMGGGVPPSPPLETETHSHQEKEEKASWKVLGGSKSVATIVVPFFLQRESPRVCLMRRPEQHG